MCISWHINKHQLIKMNGTINTICVVWNLIVYSLYMHECI